MKLFLIINLIKFCCNVNNSNIRKKTEIRIDCKNNKKIKLISNKNECENKHFKDKCDNKIKKSWKEYIFSDNYTFESDVAEMYYKYKCDLFNNDIQNINDFTGFYKNEKIVSNLDLHDINAFFNNEENNIQSLKDIHYNTNTEIITKTQRQPEFFKLFYIIEKDFLTILENASKFNFIRKDYFESIKNHFKNLHKVDDKVILLFKIAQQLESLNIQDHNLLNSNKSDFIYSTLVSSRFKISYKDHMREKISKKFNLLTKYTSENKISDNKILKYCMSNINNTDDKIVRTICVLGLKNLFIKNKNMTKPNFFTVLIFLYIFNFERNFNYVNWYKKITQVLFISEKYILSKISNFIYQQLFSDNKKVSVHKFYIAINSDYVERSLYWYKNLQKYSDQLHYINYVIDLVNLIKCKIFGIMINK